MVTYFSLIPYALMNLMNQFNKGADSLLFLCLYIITFLVYIIFIILDILINFQYNKIKNRICINKLDFILKISLLILDNF